MNLMPIIEQYQHWGTFGLLLLAGFGAPFPEDIVLVSSGFIAYKTNTPLFLTILVSFLGVMIGDGIMFFFGHHFGERVMNMGYFKKILPQARKDKIRNMFQKYGSKIIFIARFMPGLRAPIFVVTGSMGVRYSVFAFWDGMAALLSVPAFCAAGFLFGNKIQELIDSVRNVEQVALSLIGVLVLYWVIKNVRKRKSNSLS